jgi:nitric oxide reductase subunit B
MHGHLAFWGAYGMLVLGIIAYAMPNLTGRKLYDRWWSGYAFWATNIGMVAMTLALAAAGVTQVVLERRAGMDFLAVQKEIQWHFLGMILAASLFTSGMLAYIYMFILYGLPNPEQFGRSAYEEELGAEARIPAEGAVPSPT